MWGQGYLGMTTLGPCRDGVHVKVSTGIRERCDYHLLLFHGGTEAHAMSQT